MEDLSYEKKVSVFTEGIEACDENGTPITNLAGLADYLNLDHNVAIGAKRAGVVEGNCREGYSLTVDPETAAERTIEATRNYYRDRTK